jgi:hypothetical protein
MTPWWISGFFSVLPLLIFGTLLWLWIRRARHNPNADISAEPLDRYQQLARLTALRDRGVLTESEFVQEKYRILGIDLDPQSGDPERDRT